MSQDFSVAYRAPNIVDVLIPKITDRTAYRLLASPQFDGAPAFVQIAEATNAVGVLDPAVDRRRLSSMPAAEKRVRIVFDPDTFATGEPVDAGLDDTRQFWMQFQPVDNGVPGAVGEPTLILTPSQHNGQAQIAINGTAPNAGDVSGSLVLCLGRRMTNFVISNPDNTNSLFVAFNPAGPEFEVQADTTVRLTSSMESTLVVRGGGGTIAFSATMTVATLS